MIWKILTNLLPVSKISRNHERRVLTAAALPYRCDGGEERHTCGDCGDELQIVRPGKYQCVNPKCSGNISTTEAPGYGEWIDGIEKGLQEK
jgi:hypothetical protein